MADTIKIRRSSTAAAVPTTSQLADGELGLNINDGILYTPQNIGGTRTMQALAGGKQFLLKTGNYTILPSDPKVIGFFGTADGTFTLPAASSCVGQEFDLYNLTSNTIASPTGAHNLFVALSGGDFLFNQDALLGDVIPAPIQGKRYFSLPSGDGGWICLGNAVPPNALTWAQAPIEIVNSTGASFSSASSVTTSPAWPFAPLPGSVPAGALYVVCATWNSASVTATVTAAGGNTFTPVFGSPIVEGSQSSQMWYCCGGMGLVGSETFTVTFSGPVTGYVAAAAFSGIALASALDASNSSEASSGVTTVNPTVTTTQGQDLIVAFTYGANTLTGAAGALTLQSNASGPAAILQVAKAVNVGNVAQLPVTQSTGAAIGLIAAFKGLAVHLPELPTLLSSNDLGDVPNTATARTNLGIVKVNSTTSDPGTGNDGTQGYAVGSTWVNTSTQREWVAISVATGAAVWRKQTTIVGNKDGSAALVTFNIGTSVPAGLYRVSAYVAFNGTVTIVATIGWTDENGHAMTDGSGSQAASGNTWFFTSIPFYVNASSNITVAMSVSSGTGADAKYHFALEAL